MNNGHRPPGKGVRFPPGTAPIDRLWQVMIKWGVTRTFEDNLQVIDVMLRKDELDGVVRQCYGVEVKKGG
ncbi:MAG TPA: hypothetical protein ENI23_16090 [bacterium]|nr:hypothetical protein [bacterium]